MEKMTCPICGEKFDQADMGFLDNGNPACLACVEKELKHKEISFNTSTICGNCGAEIKHNQKICGRCGKEYTPFICEKCKREITTETKFCTSCGSRVRPKRERERRKTIILSAIIVSIVLIVTTLLVLFIPYESYDNCDWCDGGYRRCAVGSFDCGLCTNGYVECSHCYGSGYRYQTTNNWKEWT